MTKSKIEQIANQMISPKERGILTSYYWSNPKLNEGSLVLAITPFDEKGLLEYMLERGSIQQMFGSVGNSQYGNLLKECGITGLFREKTTKKHLTIEVLAQDLIKAINLSNAISQKIKLRILVGYGNESECIVFSDSENEIVQAQYALNKEDFNIRISAIHPRGLYKKLLQAYYINLKRNSN